MLPKRRAATTLSLAALTLSGATLRAQPSAALSLEWSAPPGCGSSDDVRRRAEVLLGGPIEPRLSPHADAIGAVSEENGRFSLRLETVADFDGTIEAGETGCRCTPSCSSDSDDDGVWRASAFWKGNRAERNRV